MPIETAKSLAVGTVSLVSGSVSSPSDLKPLRENTIFAVTVSVSPSSVSRSRTFTVSGSVSAPYGKVAYTAVFIKVTNPSGNTVAVGSAPVSGVGATGTYSQAFTAGGSSSWVGGRYEVVATYGKDDKAVPVSAKAYFEYS